jgi:hypothetical protein
MAIDSTGTFSPTRERLIRKEHDAKVFVEERKGSSDVASSSDLSVPSRTEVTV